MNVSFWYIICNIYFIGVEIFEVLEEIDVLENCLIDYICFGVFIKFYFFRVVNNSYFIEVIYDFVF